MIKNQYIFIFLFLFNWNVIAQEDFVNDKELIDTTQNLISLAARYPESFEERAQFFLKNPSRFINDEAFSKTEQRKLNFFIEDLVCEDSRYSYREKKNDIFNIISRTILQELRKEVEFIKKAGLFILLRQINIEST